MTQRFAANIVLMRNNADLRQRQVSNALKYVEAHSWDVERHQYLGIVGFFGGQGAGASVPTHTARTLRHCNF